MKLQQQCCDNSSLRNHFTQTSTDKQTNKVNTVKDIDEDGKLQTVPPTQNHSSDFIRVDKNSDLFSNFFSNFFRKLKETEGVEFFKSDASQVEDNAKTIQGNADKPTP